jgi:hypothetical protein
VPVISPAAVSVVIPELPRLADHHIAGNATLPAVELLELLARTMGKRAGWGDRPPLPLAMTDVVFPRFLPVDEIPRCAFQVEVVDTAGGARASLRSRIDLPGGMQRTREHAAATFARSAQVPPPPPPPPSCDCDIAAERIYAELIPFGPRYRNLRETVGLGETGGIGIVRSPASPSDPSPMLGCPFLLDAAMHLACVWGQRYAGYVAYPTGFASRVLSRPTPSGERRCLVLPRSVEPRRLLCDLWLLDGSGQVCDAVTGLAMSPLASGAPPPPWLSVPEERA